MQFELPSPFRAVRLRVVAAGVAASLTVALATGVPAAAVWEESPIGSETGEIVISELFVDPDAVVDSRGEFIELHNPTGGTVDLRGWTIGDEQYDQYEIRDLEIAAGGYAVLARFGEFDRNGGIVADEVYGDAVILVNRGDRVILRDSTGALVDMVDYSTGAWPVVPGRSMAVRDLGADNNDPGNWCLSTTTLRNGDLASPGRANTCSWSSARLVISEVLFNPRATSDFVGEWFELTNVGDAPVDLVGFTIQDERGESFRVDRSLIVEPGGRAVLGVTDDRSVNGDVVVEYAYGDAMRLFNAVDELIVNDADGVLVDRIGWDDGLTFPDPYGASMVLADLALDGSDGANWCVSTTSWAGGDLGTPGTTGGCTLDGVADVVISEIMFDPEQAGSERAGEWFELVNVGDAPAVLDGYRVRTYLAEYVIGSLTIEPGAVAVLAAEGDTSLNGGVVADYVYERSLPLHNVAGRLAIVSPSGHLVDDVRWSANRGFPHEPGRSIELRSADADNSLGANWCLADEPIAGDANGGDANGDVDFATPGRVGSCPEPAPVASVHINEVMHRPSAVIDTFGEWIEIHNAMDEPVDLFNWTITDDGSDYFRIRTSLVVPAGGYLVIGRHGDQAVNGGVDVDVVTGAAMVLLNHRDSVVLTDQYGRRVDRVAWDGVGDMPSPRGASASLASDGSWCVTATQYGAGDRGTPGAPNDCVPYQRGAVVINEIHRDPEAVVDSRGEWIELHNRTDTAVDISGWTLRDDGYDSFTFDPGTPLVIQPHGFLVAARNGPALNGGIAVDVVYGVEIHLRNIADDLTLLDRNLEIVDRVAWTPMNGFPLVPGASMSLRHPDLDGAIGANWCAAITDQGNGDFGTPGAPNVCEPEVLPPDEPPVDEPPVDEPPVDEPPVDEPPVDEPATEPTHALFAVGAPSCPADLEVRASVIDIVGDARSNHSVKIEGSTIRLDGSVSHGGPATIGWGAIVTGGVHHQPAPEALTFGWELADFAPGGRWDTELGGYVHRHSGNLRINANQVDLPSGVHVVAGDVIIKTSKADLTGVTIVAAGSISIDATDVDVSPFAPDLPALLAGGGTCKKTSVSIGASNVRAGGVIMGLNGRVGIDATLVLLDGAVAGSSIKIGASTVTFGRPAS